ncbi:ATP-binding protein [Nocardia sp. NPDC088792]|uniref:ATP-binding protein n=1 Tax=Nocardia sp. NPDC088792 TaxID=3364332 RepID=UPI0038261AFE
MSGLPEASGPRHRPMSTESRTRTGGAGLGLAIAKENAQLLGCDVTYCRSGDSTVFTATIPVRVHVAPRPRPDCIE